MFYLILGLYIILLIIIWGFFIVARIHAYKFKNFSPHIKKVTFSLTISLIILTILGFLVIFSMQEKINNFSNNNDYDTGKSLIEKIKEKTSSSDDNIVEYDKW